MVICTPKITRHYEAILTTIPPSPSLSGYTRPRWGGGHRITWLGYPTAQWAGCTQTSSPDRTYPTPTPAKQDLGRTYRTPSPEQIHRLCENITFPCTTYVVGKIMERTYYSLDLPYHSHLYKTTFTVSSVMKTII